MLQNSDVVHLAKHPKKNSQTHIVSQNRFSILHDHARFCGMLAFCLLGVQGCSQVLSCPPAGQWSAGRERSSATSGSAAAAAAAPRNAHRRARPRSEWPNGRPWMPAPAAPREAPGHSRRSARAGAGTAAAQSRSGGCPTPLQRTEILRQHYVISPAHVL